jgi:hypothetical protein
VNFYLVPQTVFVGDRAVLSIPLDDDTAAGIPGLVLEPSSPGFPAELAALADPVIHRLVLERRGENARLFLEFSAWSPGRLEIPPFDIGGVNFSGLYIDVSSILGTGETASVLSAPALPLAIPGTSLLIYGTVTAGIFILLAVIWAGIWGPKNFRNWIQKRKRLRLIRSLLGMERRIRRRLLKSGEKNYGAMLNYLSIEFRKFLSLITGEDCRAMTAGELGKIAPLVTDADPVLTGEFLGAFFRCCDDLRFSGVEITVPELLLLLEEVRRFAETFDRVERGKI